MKNASLTGVMPCNLVAVHILGFGETQNASIFGIKKYDHQTSKRSCACCLALWMEAVYSSEVLANLTTSSHTKRHNSS
jgi:hypothetical protein